MLTREQDRLRKLPQKKAAKERSISIATNLWNKGERDLQQIADLTDLPLDEVKKLFEGKTA